MWSACLPFGVSTGGRWSGSLGFRTCRRLALVLLLCVPLLLSALLLCPRCVVLEYGFICDSNGVFSGFPLLDVGCIASMLCVACGAFVCVRCLAVLWLDACLPPFYPFFIFFAFVFRFFSVFALLLSFCPCVSVSALLCLPSCLVFVVAFSLTDYTQKRAQFLASSLGLLWACYAK